MLEIERKYLIKFPYGLEYMDNVTGSEIIQTYLTNKSNSERVRKRIYKERIEYTHTEKIRISDTTRIEEEHVISEAEYSEYLLKADPKLNTVYKTRYCCPYLGNIFEIDVYPFWNDRAVMEIELPNESDTFRIPDFISVIKEITNDKRYTNHALAASVPFDDI